MHGRLSDEAAAKILSQAVPIATRPGASPVPVRRVEGVDQEGRAVEIDVARGPGRTLLLFVSPSCQGCLDLFLAARAATGLGLREGDAVVLIVKEPSTALKDLVGDVVTVIAPEAWANYQVTGPPFFAWIDPGCSTVATEGVAWGAASIASAIAAFDAGSPALEVSRLKAPEET